jgi:undecaprenyl-diphosphatase
MFEQTEKVIFYFFNETCRDALLDYIMPTLTEIGGGTFLFGLALIILLFKSSQKRMTGIFLMAGITFSYNISYMIKNIVQRPRPFLVLQDVNTVFTTGGYSFPSNHATMVFASAVILSRTFGKKIFFFSAAVVVALSRVYLGLHYFSDVLVGGFIGSLIGLIIVHFAENAGVYPPGETA